MNVGDWIICEREAPSKGTWKQYEGRTGRIVTINVPDKEIGVRFTAGTAEVISWFKPEELRTIEVPEGAPTIRIEAERPDRQR